MNRNEEHTDDIATDIFIDKSPYEDDGVDSSDDDTNDHEQLNITRREVRLPMSHQGAALPQQDETPAPKPRGHAPADRAEEYLKIRKYGTETGLQLRRHRAQWLRYNGKHYEVLTQEELEADITNYFNGTEDRHRVNTSFVSSVVRQLTARCLIPERIELPAIEIGRMWGHAPKTVVLMNGYITMARVQHGAVPQLQEHSPTVVSRCLLPYQYLPSAECPTWVSFLEQILPDEGSRRLLQQIFGYCLTADVSLQKFFMFEGTGGNGKGVVTGILGRLVGQENTSSLSLDRFHDGHEIMVTLGKLINFMSELGAKDKISEEQLKRATGGDLMHFNPKYQQPFSAKFTAKIIISTNTRPSFSDRSNGIWRRLVVLPFPITIASDKQNPRLEDDLAEEMPGILNWAIQGALSLVTGRFQEPEESVNARKEFQINSNPARLFFDECCQLEATGQTETQELYQEYRAYAAIHGYMPLNAGNLGEEVLRLPGVSKDRVYRPSGARPHVYRGITIINPKTIG